MGSFVSHAAKALLVIVLLAQAGRVQPVTAADGPAPRSAPSPSVEAAHRSTPPDAAGARRAVGTSGGQSGADLAGRWDGEAAPHNAASVSAVIPALRGLTDPASAAAVHSDDSPAPAAASVAEGRPAEEATAAGPPVGGTVRTWLPDAERTAAEAPAALVAAAVPPARGPAAAGLSGTGPAASGSPDAPAGSHAVGPSTAVSTGGPVTPGPDAVAPVSAGQPHAWPGGAGASDSGALAPRMASANAADTRLPDAGTAHAPLADARTAAARLPDAGTAHAPLADARTAAAQAPGADPAAVSLDPDPPGAQPVASRPLPAAAAPQPQPASGEAGQALPGAAALLAAPIYRVPATGKEIVLTFDDGPSALTADFLAVLAAEEVPAAFFWLSGSERLPLAAEVVARGHQLGTHTISHPRLPGLDPAEMTTQIGGSKAALEGAAGIPVRYFRPPYGEHDRHVLETAAAHGLATVLWSVDSRDWALADDPEQIIHNVMAQVRPGAVILLHERRQTLQILPELIRRLREAGYTFVPLPPVPDGALASADEG